MISTLAALCSALFLSLRHFHLLNVRFYELRSYIQKSANFALCYLGFRSKASLRQANLAGKAAFLCCAYDVVTDWRSFSPELLKIFRHLLESYTSPDLTKIALSLYVKDRDGQLGQDGLERGGIAFIFVTRLMGTETFFRERADIERIGILLQLVDDILDYERDTKAKELNCFNSPRREDYLALANELSEDFVNIFSASFILPYVIRSARKKAEHLLDSASYQPKPSFPTKQAQD